MPLLNVQTRGDEAIIERFEHAWAVGESPDIADFVEDLIEPSAALVVELSLVDADWRRTTQQAVSINYYFERFPRLQRERTFLDEFADGFSESIDTVGLQDAVGQSISTTRDLPKLDRFKCLETVGKGGFGTVYRARDTSLGRDVALKIPRSGSFADESELKRFAREAQHAGQLKHAGIVPVYEVGEFDGIAYLVSEFVEGVTLADTALRQDFSDIAAVEIVAQVAEALDHAHRLGIVHRDVKPSNILLESVDASSMTNQPGLSRQRGRSANLPYQVRITDFGLSRSLDAEESLSADGHMLGTVAYMSPEQASGRAAEADARSDVFSVGIILYELLSGTRPFVGKYNQLLEQIQSAEPASLRVLAPNAHRDLETICWKCLRKEPANRYRTAGDLAADLRRWQQYEPIAARRATPVESLAVAVRRHPRRWTTAVITSCIVVAALVGMTLHNARLKEEVERADRHAADAHWRLYVSNMNLASEAWNQGLVGRVRELLRPFRSAQTGHDLRGWEWHYLWRQSHSEDSVVQLHDHPVSASTFLSNADLLATATDSGELKIWAGATGTELAALPSQGSPIGTLALSSSGKRLVVGRVDGMLEVWDLDSQSQSAAIQAHSGKVHSVAMSPDGTRIISSGSDREVKVWTAETGDLKWSFRAFLSDPIQVAWQPNLMDSILVLTADGMLRVWREGADREQRTFNTSRTPYVRFAVSPDRNLLAVAAHDGNVLVMNVEDGEQIFQWNGADDRVTSLAFDALAHTLVCGLENGNIHMIDASTGQHLRKTVGHINSVADVAFDCDGKMLVSVGLDGSLRTWQIQDAKDLATQRARPAVISLKVHPALDGFSAIDKNGQMLSHLFSAPNESSSHHFQHGETIRAADYSHHLDVVACGDDFGRVLLWDAKSGAKRGTLAKIRNPISTIAFAQRSDRVATANENGTVILWDISAKSPIFEFNEHAAKVLALVINADDTMIVSGCNDGTLNMWNARTGVHYFSQQAHSAGIRDVVFSNDGRIVATASNDRRVKIWDTRSGRELKELVGHTAPVTCLGFSQNDARLVSGDSAGTLHIWDADSGDMLLTITDAAETWRNVKFLASNSSLLAAGDRGIRCFYSEPNDMTKVLPERVCFPSREGAWKLNLDSWNIARWPDASAENYKRALELAERANALMPNEPWLQLTLGVARYRTGLYAEAIEALQNSRRGKREPYFSLAFEVLAAHEIGRQNIVANGLRKLRHAASMPSWRIDPNFASQYREVLALVYGDGLAPDSPWDVRCHEWRLSKANNSPKDFSAVTQKPSKAQLSSKTLSFDWGRKSPAVGVSINYYATVSSADFNLRAGKYEVQVVSKNGVRVFQDDQLIIDNWNPEEAKIGICSIDYPGGPSHFRVEHHKLDGPAYLEFRLFPKEYIQQLIADDLMDAVQVEALP